MLVNVNAWFKPSDRVRAGVASLALTTLGCHDAVLELSNHREPSRSRDQGAAGAAGAANQSGDAGGSGAAGEAGAAGAAGSGAETTAMPLESAGFCGDARGDCLFREGSLTCSGEVGSTAVQAVSGERARLLVDMTNATELRVAFELCEPRGYVLNIGDSPSNNGGGGDAGDTEHDAEILIYDSDLTASSSDLGYERPRPGLGYHPLVLSRPGYVSPEGCTRRKLYVRDQYIADSEDPELQTTTPTALRIEPGEDEQGAPDAYWFIGVNRVVSSWMADRSRVGSGVVALRLCFALAPAAPPSQSGP